MWSSERKGTGKNEEGYSNGGMGYRLAYFGDEYREVVIIMFDRMILTVKYEG